VREKGGKKVTERVKERERHERERERETRERKIVRQTYKHTNIQRQSERKTG
jgi:hypothetical protein